MKVLVTGANGFLASNIIKELLSRKHEVTGMLRKTASMQSIKDIPFERFYGDFTNVDDIRKASRGCEVIIHVAANTDQNSTFANYQRINIEPSLNILRIAGDNSCRRIIFISTANVFGFGDLLDPGNEEDDIDPLFKNSGYAYSKYLAQKKLIEESEKYGVEVIICNPSFMLGEGDSKPGAGRIILMYLKRKYILIPPGGRNFIYVRDVAVGVCNALTMGRNGESYLLSNINMDYREFFHLLDKLFLLKRFKIYLPKIIVRGMGLLSELLIRIGSRSDLTYNNAKILCIESYYTSDKAVKELQLPLTPIETGILEAFHWFRANGYIKPHWLKN